MRAQVSEQNQSEHLFAQNPAYREYEHLLVQLHRLIAEGQGDSEAADILRDAMDEPDRKLSHQEVARLNGLSSDLYMLSPGHPRGFTTDGEQREMDHRTTEALHAMAETRSPEPLRFALNAFREEIIAAEERGDWESVLALLRNGLLEFVPRHVIAYVRAMAYEALGHSEVALLFYSHAARTDPQYRDLPKLLQAA